MGSKLKLISPCTLSVKSVNSTQANNLEFINFCISKCEYAQWEREHVQYNPNTLPTWLHPTSTHTTPPHPTSVHPTSSPVCAAIRYAPGLVLFLPGVLPSLYYPPSTLRLLLAVYGVTLSVSQAS